MWLEHHRQCRFQNTHSISSKRNSSKTRDRFDQHGERIRFRYFSHWLGNGHIRSKLPLHVKSSVMKANFMQNENRPFSYSTKEPGSSDIFTHFYERGSIEWR